MIRWARCSCFMTVLLLLAVCAGSLDKNVPGHFRIYVTNENSGDLSVMDGATLEVIATVPLGKRPRGIHASPDGKTIYVALSGSPIGGPGVDESKLPPPDKTADGIGVFDVRQNKLVRTIQSGSDPENFDLSKDGRQIFVSNEDDSKASVIDVATGKVEKSFPVGEEPEGVKVSPNGKFVYVTSENTGTISVIDRATEKLLKTFKVGRRPRSVAFMPDGSRAYVNAENDGAVVVVDAVKHEMLRSISLGTPGVIKPMAVLLSHDGSKLYVSTGRGHRIFIIDTGNRQNRRLAGSRRASVGYQHSAARRQDSLHGQRAWERHFRGGFGQLESRPEGEGRTRTVGRDHSGTVVCKFGHRVSRRVSHYEESLVYHKTTFRDAGHLPAAGAMLVRPGKQLADRSIAQRSAL